jgi:hypothetical protein
VDLDSIHAKQRRFRFSLRALLAFVFFLSILFLFMRPLNWKGSLVKAVSNSKQVVIESNVEGDQQRIVLESNRDVMKILDAVEIDEEASDASCACEGSTLLRFSDGKGKVQVLSIHHGEHLRWLGGQWPCDASLTSKSAKALDELLVYYGYRLPAVP